MGRSSLESLYAVGEAGCSGLHGANRLGSNSCSKASPSAPAPASTPPAPLSMKTRSFRCRWSISIPASTKTELDITDVKSSLRSVMWRNAAIERTGPRLDETQEIISFWSRYVMDKTFDAARGVPAAPAGNCRTCSRSVL